MGAGGVREPGGWRPSAERLGVGGVREPGGGETRDRRARPAQGRARKYEVTENNGRKGGLEATPGLVEGGAGLHQRPAMRAEGRFITTKNQVRVKRREEST